MGVKLLKKRTEQNLSIFLSAHLKIKWSANYNSIYSPLAYYTTISVIISKVSIFAKLPNDRIFVFDKLRISLNRYLHTSFTWT